MKKEGLILVTEVKPRVHLYPERLVQVPAVDPPTKWAFYEPEFLTWWERYGPSAIPVAEENLPRARALALLAWEAQERGDTEEVLRIRDGLRTLQSFPLERKTKRQSWSHLLVQMPGDIGGPNKWKIRRILSARYRGKILEAMCGFNSYLLPAADREVIALDFCQEALERYRYSRRTRIIFDLNRVQRRQGIPFLEDGEFDAVVICFGFNYLNHPVWVFREFRRILRPSGSLVLVENPWQGYWNLARRSFHPKSCQSFLNYAGFKSISVEVLPVAADYEREAGRKYYLVEATKG